MTRRLKALGLCLGALLAIGALGASGAAAQFESEAEETALTVSSNSTQQFAFKAGGTAIACTGISFDNATQIGVEGGGGSFATQAITVEPTYSNCHSFLGQSLSVDTNGCDYVLHLEDNSTEGTTDIECPTATGIQFTVGSICIYEFDTQTGLGTVSYSNKGSGTTREIVVEPNLTGITSTRTTNHFFCPAGSSEGVFSGNLTLTGEDSGGSHVGILVD